MAKKTVRVAAAAIGALSGAFAVADASLADAGTEVVRPAQSVLSTSALTGDSVLANSIRNVLAQSGTVSDAATTVALAQFWNSAPPSVELAQSWGSAPPSVAPAQFWSSAPPAVGDLTGPDTTSDATGVTPCNNWSSAPPAPVEI